VHDNKDFQFLPLDPSPDTFPAHKEWWTPKLKHLLHSIGNGLEAEAKLARSILEVQFFPYRSCSNRYDYDKLSLSSQDYSRSLVSNAMKRGAVIVIRHAKTRWFRAVPKLKNYENTFPLWVRWNQAHISPDGFVDPNGYQTVVDKINAGCHAFAASLR